MRRVDRPVPRVTRMMTVARDLGIVPVFVGANRGPEPSTTPESEGFEIRRIGRSFRRFHGTNLIGYFLSVVTFSVSLMRFLWQVRPALVHASDFEVYAAARLYTFFCRAGLIYNIHDNLADRYRCPRMARTALNLMEGVAVRLAPVTVVPEASRRDALPRWCRNKVRIVRNSPIDPGYQPPPPAGRIVTLLYAGWIDAGRGIRQLARLAASHGSVRLRMAGAGDSRLLGEMAERPRVDSLGRLSHAEALRETAACDFVCALYDPEIPVNRHAASNKVAEALAIGRPVLINREVEVTKLLAPYRCTVVVDYHESDRAASLLVALREAAHEYEGMCLRARQAYDDHYSWEHVKNASIETFELAGVSKSS